MSKNNNLKFNNWQASFIQFLNSLNLDKNTINDQWVPGSNDRRYISYEKRISFKSEDLVEKYCRHKGTRLEVLNLLKEIFKCSSVKGQGPLEDKELIEKFFKPTSSSKPKTGEQSSSSESKTSEQSSSSKPKTGEQSSSSESKTSEQSSSSEPKTSEQSSSSKLGIRNNFLNSCGKLLWNLGHNVDSDLIFYLLLWAGKTKGEEKLDHEDKQIIYEEILDYLTETRQNEKWSQLMLYWSKQSNQDIIRVLRSRNNNQNNYEKAINYIFNRNDQSDNLNDSIKDCIKTFNKEDFEKLAFFFKKYNVLVNDYRHKNFQEKFINDKLNQEDISEEDKQYIKQNWLEKKGIIRNFFNWSKNHLEQFINIVLELDNEHRWYFLSVALRLKYDRAKWLVSSGKKDREEACNLYQEIIKATEQFEKEKQNEICVPKDAECRLYYMTATAYRYLSQCAEYKTYFTKNKQDLVIKAIKYAKKAFDEWESECNRKEKDEKDKIREGKKNCLKYVFSRHYAKIVTFAVRWMLTHNKELGDSDDLILDDPKFKDIIIDDFLSKLLYSAFLKYQECIQNSLCNKKESSECEIIKGKLQLEYEFHLRVWISLSLKILSKNILESNWTDDEVKSNTKYILSFVTVIYGYLYMGEFNYQGNNITKLQKETVNKAYQCLIDKNNQIVRNRLTFIFPIDTFCENSSKGIKYKTQQEIPSSREAMAETIVENFKKTYDGDIDEKLFNLCRPDKLIEEIKEVLKNDDKNYISYLKKDEEEKTREEKHNYWKLCLTNTPGFNLKRLQEIYGGLFKETNEKKNLKLDIKNVEINEKKERDISELTKLLIQALVCDEEDLYKIFYPDSNSSSRRSSKSQNRDKTPQVIISCILKLMVIYPDSGKINLQRMGKNTAKKDEFEIDLNSINKKLEQCYSNENLKRDIDKTIECIKKEESQEVLKCYWYGLIYLLYNTNEEFNIDDDMLNNLKKIYDKLQNDTWKKIKMEFRYIFIKKFFYQLAKLDFDNNNLTTQSIDYIEKTYKIYSEIIYPIFDKECKQMIVFMNGKRIQKEMKKLQKEKFCKILLHS